jgi:hypothetical protein
LNKKGLMHSVRFPENTVSAKLILPILFKVAGRFESAVDVGGGTGAWARALQESGVNRVICIDDPAIGKDELLIDSSYFIGCDLSREFPQVARAELAVCLELAEHLPEAQSEPLVRFLTSCADVVLFSASIPGQPSPYHINEQPPAYWRRLFGERGFRTYDCIRPHILDNKEIPYWYRQNIILFASESSAAARGIGSEPFAVIPDDFELVHEKILASYRSRVVGTIRDIPRIIIRSLLARFRKR